MAVRLGERFDCLFLLLVDFEQVEQADHLQRLDCELGWVQELERSTVLLSGGEETYQQSDAAGVDHLYFTQVDDEPAAAILKKVFHRTTKPVHTLP